MKKTLSLVLFFFLALSAKAEMLRDTTIIEFSDKSVNKRVTVISNGGKEFELPLSLNLDNVLKELDIDSKGREKALVLASNANGKKDTILVISREGQRIQIIAHDLIAKIRSDSLIIELPDDLGNDHEADNDEYQDPKNGQRREQISRFFPESDFGFYLGLNQFLNASPSAPLQQYGLKTLKSRYLAFSFRKNVTMLRGSNADLALSYGPELSIYHFRFKNSNTAVYRNSQVSFEDAGFTTKKSKFVIPYLNFPVLLNLGLKKERLKLGLGGYLGYRIGAYTKTKDQKGNKEKVKTNYGLNNLLYGLTAEIGKKNGLGLFIRYDLNQLFKPSQINGKELRAFSFGIRI